MDKKTITKNLSDIYYTLNQMTITGDKNIQYMYGVMTVLKEMVELINTEEQPEEE